MDSAARGEGVAPALVDRRDMPYSLSEGLGEGGRIGLIVLATDQTLEYEFRLLLAQREDVAVYVSRVYNEAEITPRTLSEMDGRITQACEQLVPEVRLDVVAYACTSGSLVIGEDAVRRRIRKVRPGVACTTPMEAARAALEVLGVTRLCFLPPYLDDINQAMRQSLMKTGLAVPVMGSWNISDDDKVARLSTRTLRTAVLELGAHPQVDGVFVPCTNVRMAGIAQSLEDELGKPVISSSLATIWHCLRLAGHGDEISGFGRLFHSGLGGRCEL